VAAYHLLLCLQQTDACELAIAVCRIQQLSGDLMRHAFVVSALRIITLYVRGDSASFISYARRLRTILTVPAPGGIASVSSAVETLQAVAVIQRCLIHRFIPKQRITLLRQIREAVPSRQALPLDLLRRILGFGDSVPTHKRNDSEVPAQFGWQLTAQFCRRCGLRVAAAPATAALYDSNDVELLSATGSDVSPSLLRRLYDAAVRGDPALSAAIEARLEVTHLGDTSNGGGRVKQHDSEHAILRSQLAATPFREEAAVSAAEIEGTAQLQMLLRVGVGEPT
jgi:hypothetical protein